MSNDKRPTVIDVARAADVAVGTVSRYLNGQNLREKTRVRLEAAIDELGFRADPVARAMKSSRTRTLGFVTPAFDGFNGVIMTEMVRAFRDIGYSMLFFSHAYEDKAMQDAIQSAADRRIDGLVFSGNSAAKDELEQLSASGIPVVLYNNDVPGLVADRVLVNDRAATAHAVTRMIELGHRRIGIALGDLDTQTARNRQLGYRDALTAAGLPLDPVLEHPGSWAREVGAEATRAFLTLDDPATAVFYSSDRIGRGALEFILTHQLRPGIDLSMVCFDDHEVFRLYPPGIATIEQPIGEIAVHVARCMAARLDGSETGPPREILLDCTLHERPSLQKTQGKLT